MRKDLMEAGFLSTCKCKIIQGYQIIDTKLTLLSLKRTLVSEKHSPKTHQVETYIQQHKNLSESKTERRKRNDICTREFKQSLRHIQNPDSNNLYKSKNLFKTFTCIGGFSKIFSSKSFAVVVIRNYPGVLRFACTNNYLENIYGVVTVSVCWVLL